MPAIARVLGRTDPQTTKVYVEDDTAMAAKLLIDQKQTKTKKDT